MCVHVCACVGEEKEQIETHMYTMWPVWEKKTRSFRFTSSHNIAGEDDVRGIGRAHLLMRVCVCERDLQNRPKYKKKRPTKETNIHDKETHKRCYT